jgi:hypothetical protein
MDGEDVWAVIGLICVFAKKVSEVYSSVPSGYPSVNVTGIVLVNNSQGINVSRNVSGCAAFVWHPPNPPLLATNPQWDAYYVPPPPPPPSPAIYFELPDRSNIWVSINGMVKPEPELEEPFYLHKVYVDKDILQRLRQQLWQRLSDLLRVTNALNFDLWNSEVSVQANKETQFLLISNKGNERMLLGTKPHWSSYYQPHWSSYQKPRLEIVDNRSIVTAIPEQKRVNRNERVLLGMKPHWSSYYQPHWSSYQKPRLEIVDNRRHERDSMDYLYKFINRLLQQIMIFIPEDVQKAFANVMQDSSWIYSREYNVTEDFSWIFIREYIACFGCLIVSSNSGFFRDLSILSYCFPKLKLAMGLCQSIVRICSRQPTSGVPAVKDAPAVDAGGHSGQVSCDESLTDEAVRKALRDKKMADNKAKIMENIAIILARRNQ